MKRSTQPYHCRGCQFWHKAGHPKGSPLRGSKYDNWCCKFGNHAPKCIQMCITQNAKRIQEEA